MENSSNQNNESVVIEERITKVNGDFYIKKYSKGKFLGKGGFAKVYYFTNLENNKLMAGKVIPKANLNRSRSRQKLMSEIRLHKSIRHPNVVKFEHVFEDHENVYILLELCDNQSMNELIKRRKTLTEFEVQCYVIQIVEALKYLHINRIIHRDLKLGNIFLSDKMQVKLGDFGLASKLEFDGEKKRTVCGTPNYIAPEILDGNVGHSYQVDVWALGVIIYTLIIGKPPFETKDIKLTYKKIKENDYSFPENAKISDHARDIVTRILVTQPEKRLTLDEILLHPFINHGGPVPKHLPVSTLACPPTTSYIKQFASTSTSHRVRVNSEFEMLESLDLLKSPKGLNSSRLPTHLRTPTGSDLYGGNFFLPTPKSPKLETLGSDRFNPLRVAAYESSKMMMPLTPKSPKQRIFSSIGEHIKEEQEEYIPNTIEDKKAESPPKTTYSEDDIRVLKWYDYSVKYGLAYILSTGALGVYFNDGTKLTAISEEAFDYVVRRSSDKQDIPITYSFSAYPEEIHKKVLVYQHFREHYKTLIDTIEKQDTFVYVKKWIKTKHAVLFRLNNRILQVCFKDETVLIMNSNTKKLTYIDVKKNEHICDLDGAMSNDNKELVKRFKYTEEVLKQIWNVQTDQAKNGNNENYSTKEPEPSEQNVKNSNTYRSEVLSGEKVY